jgi:hypothetical protein
VLAEKLPVATVVDCVRFAIVTEIVFTPVVTDELAVQLKSTFFTVAV